MTNGKAWKRKEKTETDWKRRSGKIGKQKGRAEHGRAAKERANVWKGDKIIWNKNAPGECLERKETGSLERKVHACAREGKNVWKSAGERKSAKVVYEHPV